MGWTCSSAWSLAGRSGALRDEHSDTDNSQDSTQLAKGAKKQILRHCTDKKIMHNLYIFGHSKKKDREGLSHSRLKLVGFEERFKGL